MKHIKFRCSKLVRDHSPEHLSQGGAIVHETKCHDKAELISYFKKKIVEEAAEVLESKDKEELLDELADCLEVIKGLLKQIEVSEEEMEEVRQKKLQKRGGFLRPYCRLY